MLVGFAFLTPLRRPVIHRGANGNEYIFETMGDLRIGESEDRESSVNQKRRSPTILLGDILPIMNIAVDFDHQPG